MKRDRHPERSEESRRLAWIVLGALTLGSTPAFATGSVECLGKTREGVSVAMRWGTNRGVGSARIAPYTLTIGNEKPELKELEEVGYWVDDKRAFVRLLDPNAVDTQVLLLTEVWKDGNLGGVLTVGKPLVPAPVKVVVRCIVE